MKPSIKAIGQMTGFSTATVSNALNHKRGVNRETADKIWRAAKEIGYTPRVDRVKLVIYKADGSVVNDSPFFTQLFAGVEAECRAIGMETVSCYLERSDPNYDVRLAELLADAGSALIILATEMDEGEAARLQEAQAPVVILDNWYESLPFNAVLIDNTDAAYKAVAHLIQMGHTRIGHLKGKFEIKNFYYRRQGYLLAMSEMGLEADPAYTFPLSTGMESSCADMMALLESRPELPSAFFADNDMIALGAVRALEQKGYRVPEDVSVVGFDDLPFCAISNPPLTTIKVYNYEMGRAAVRRLAELIDMDGNYCTKTQITSSLVLRDSVRDLREQSGEASGAGYDV